MSKETYTQEEIQGKVNILTNQMNMQKLERTELSTSINDKKKQIAYWEELDRSQCKLF